MLSNNDNSFYNLNSTNNKKIFLHNDNEKDSILKRVVEYIMRYRCECNFSMFNTIYYKERIKYFY